MVGPPSDFVGWRFFFLENTQVTDILKRILIIFMACLIGFSCDKPTSSNVKNKPPSVKEATRGVWVTVFSKEKVLYSKQNAQKLIEFCKRNGINEIYLQILRAGEAYYDSPILGQSKYENMVKEFGGDPIDAIIKQAKNNNLKVYAWINVLSLAQNKKAPILLKYGKSVLTRDKNLRASIRGEDIDDSDTYYLRDDQLFLEPGDEKVVDFFKRIVEEIVLRYPGLNGLHLDYIRYPYPVPFVPDSRFMDYGVTYGFGERNLERFKIKTGLNPNRDDPFAKDLSLKWDDWKRSQVTNLVQSISGVIRNKARDWRISCAVVPTYERAYSIAFQDWPLWLDQGLIDYVVLMNYTKDDRLLESSVKSAMGLIPKEKIHVGLGLFLHKQKETFLPGYELIKKLNPSGIIFYSYDELIGLGIDVKNSH